MSAKKLPGEPIDGVAVKKPRRKAQPKPGNPDMSRRTRAKAAAKKKGPKPNTIPPTVAGELLTPADQPLIATTGMNQNTPNEEMITQRQWAFVMELVKDPTMNATAAAIRTGTSPAIASSTASKWLDMPKVQELIKLARERLARKYEIDQQFIVDHLLQTAQANMMDYISVRDDGIAEVDLSNLTRDQAAAIQEVTHEKKVSAEGGVTYKTKLKLYDRNKALMDLGTVLGIVKPPSAGINVPPGSTVNVQNNWIMQPAVPVGREIKGETE